MLRHDKTWPVAGVADRDEDVAITAGLRGQCKVLREFSVLPVQVDHCRWRHRHCDLELTHNDRDQASGNSFTGRLCPPRFERPRIDPRPRSHARTCRCGRFGVELHPPRTVMSVDRKGSFDTPPVTR
jgi:hypothetical protein